MTLFFLPSGGYHTWSAYILRWIYLFIFTWSKALIWGTVSLPEICVICLWIYVLADVLVKSNFFGFLNEMSLSI